MDFNFGSTEDNRKETEDILKTYRQASRYLFGNPPGASECTQYIKSLNSKGRMHHKKDVVANLQNEVNQLRKQLNLALQQLESKKNLEADYQHMIEQFSRLSAAEKF